MSGRALRLAVLSTHPIQYFSPLWRELASRPDVDLTVFYAHRPTPEQQGAGFGIAFEWDVDLLAGYRSVWLENRAKRPGVTHFRGCDTPGIAEEIAGGGFDALLVLGWNMRCFWQGIVAAWRSGTPALVRGDSQLVPTSLPKRIVKRLVYPRFLSRFDVCLSVGERSEAYFRHYGARRIVRAPHFVDNGYFATAADAARTRRDAIRAEWGADPGDLVALFAGKFIPQKQPSDFVRALAHAGIPELRGVFVGEGELRAPCERLAREIGAPAVFVGFRNQSQMADAYAGADLLVLPSVSETWGLVVNEAMASGIPVVASDAVGCVPDLVIDDVTGWSYPAGEVQALIATLRRAASSRGRLAEMGARARAHVAGFSVQRAADGVMAGVREAMVGRRR